MATREETQQMIEVMQAYLDGKAIECNAMRNGPERGWMDCQHLDACGWNHAMFRYRVKPEPREWWIVPEYGAVFCDKQPRRVRFDQEGDNRDYDVVHVREVVGE
jgi:hypothetical protein